MNKALSYSVVFMMLLSSNGQAQQPPLRGHVTQNANLPPNTVREDPSDPRINGGVSADQLQCVSGWFIGPLPDRWPVTIEQVVFNKHDIHADFPEGSHFASLDGSIEVDPPSITIKDLITPDGTKIDYVVKYDGRKPIYFNMSLGTTNNYSFTVNNGLSSLEGPNPCQSVKPSPSPRPRRPRTSQNLPPEHRGGNGRAAGGDYPICDSYKDQAMQVNGPVGRQEDMCRYYACERNGGHMPHAHVC